MSGYFMQVLHSSQTSALKGLGGKRIQQFENRLILLV